MAAKDFLPNITPPTPAPALRDVSQKLPGYIQSPLLQKFFNATVNQLFQPDAQETISGYIGERSGTYYNPATDYYIDEPTSTRVNYQLEPAVVSVDNNNNTNFVETYPDIVNALQFDGALDNNQSRLFAENYYSWAPPINIDMFVNFSNYFWVPSGPQLNIITDTTSAVTEILGQVNYTTPTSGLVFQSGMRVQFTNDANTDYNGIPFIIEGVGTSISLINDSQVNETNDYVGPAYDTTLPSSFLSSTPDYWTMRRGSQDGNPWSRSNRWFHKDILGVVGSPVQAHRPILEFIPNMELRNFARYARNNVTVYSSSDQISDIIGQASYVIDGHILQDDDTILVTGNSDSDRNNMIYKVFGIELYGIIGLTVFADGIDKQGNPVAGEGVFIVDGTVNAGFQYYYDGLTWVYGQQKLQQNKPIIFNLYDINGYALDNPVEHPSSDFNGSEIFNYSPQDTTNIDPYLEIPLLFSDFGEISFDNLITTQRYSALVNTTQQEIIGYYFYRIFQSFMDQGTDTYLNDWHESQFQSRQYVMDRFILVPTITSEGYQQFQLNFTLSITPDTNVEDQPYNSRVYLNGVVLVAGVDYDIIADELNLSLSLALSANDVLEIESYAATIPEINGNGYFEIPGNLNSNPDNQQVTTQTFNDIIPHLTEIIANQFGITGYGFGDNNYRNTARDPSLGNLILNHYGSLLRVGLFTGNENLVLTDAIIYNNREYNSFKAKFLNKIQQYALQGYTSAYPAASWVADALASINVGKTPGFPFTNSATYSATSYIPSTAATLGITNLYSPQIYLDTTKITPVNVILGHDGSLYQTYGDFRDQVILELENQIYNYVDVSYQDPDINRIYQLLSVKPGYFRTTVYSLAEWNQVSQPAFERWVVSNRLDYVINNTYDAGNPFTWNYSTCYAPDKVTHVPGSWRGIFNFFYDTDRPHIAPWEMLGFAQEPVWWVPTYGPAPYTANNLILWTDLQNGTIRAGLRQGTYDYLARPGLVNLIPVDGQGNLLNPIQIGLVTLPPNNIFAQANWVFGDIGPVEYNWRISSSFPYDLAETMFLAKPAVFCDIFWELRKLAFSNGQLYDLDLARRSTSADLTVHNEILTDGSTATVRGISNWVSDYLSNMNLNINQNFANLEQYLGVKLAYKSGSFLDSSNLRVVSETFGIVPAEDVTVQLYKGASISQPVYSAVIVIWDGSSYRVSGYDQVNQTFTILPGIPNGPSTSITAGNVTINRLNQGSSTPQEIIYYTSFPTREQVYNFMIGYQRYLESQGWQFAGFDSINNQPINFDTMAQQFLIWSQVQLYPGQSIILSPLSDNAIFNYTQGFVENTQSFVNGVYSILDRTGFGIAANQFQVTRDANEFAIRINNSSVQGIYCLRLSIVEYEHILLLDNTTIFNDLIYSPVMGIRQPRFEAFIDRAQYWTGFPTARGFLIQNNSLMDNFEYSVDNMRRFYDFDIEPATGIQGELAQHLIGFQERDWMKNLIVDPISEVKFYQGFIGQKGTQQAFDNIARSTYVTATSGFTPLEEWAFLVGTYGNVTDKSQLEIQVIQNQFVTNPQIIEFVNTSTGNPNVIDIVPNDPRWILTNYNNTTNNQFTYRGFVNNYRQDFPNAGYVQVNETTYTMLNLEAFEPLFETVVGTNSSFFNDGDTIWAILLDNGSWTVYRVCEDAQLLSVEQGVNPGDPTVFTTVETHGLLPGDTIFFQTTTSTSPDQLGVNTVYDTPSATTFRVTSAISTGIVYPSQAIGTLANPIVTPTDTLILDAITVTLTGTTVTQTIIDINTDSSIISAGIVASASLTQQLIIQKTDGSTITISGTAQATFGLPNNTSYTGVFPYALKPIRFTNESARNSFTPFNGWLTGDETFVDDNGLQLWEVTAYNGSGWNILRTETDLIDIDQIYTSWVYNNETHIDITQLQLFDPFKGLIFSAAEEEIGYQTDYDPAYYNTDDGTDPNPVNIQPDLIWGANQVGILWFDLSAVRFLWYEQGDDFYKRKYWGQIAPGTSVNIYEWTQSPVPPSGWDSYVLSQQATGNAQSNIPTGTVPLGEDTPYVAIDVYNPQTNTDQTLYYFWVLNPTQVPLGIAFRSLDAQSVSELISMPYAELITWLAPITTNAFIVSNLQNDIDNLSSVLQINFLANAADSIIHKQWILLREFDPSIPPYQPLWNKMRDSLVGYDDLNNSVPDPTLSEVVRYGNNFRPRQTWFANMYQARLEFFEVVNTLFSTLNVSNIVGFETNLNQTQPLPPITAYDYSVPTRAARDALDGKIPAGKIILVFNDELLNNYWSLWLYGGGTIWTLLQEQLYNTSIYWSFVDYYATGYSSATIIRWNFGTIAEMNAAESEFKNGDIIKVANNGSGNWSIYLYTIQANVITFTQVAEQNGTIAFDLSLATFDTTNQELVAQTAAVTKIFVEAIQANILTVLQQNLVFFAMNRYVHWEQSIVPWALKTSMIYGQGFDAPFNQNPIQQQDLTDYLIEYFDECKPYHTKLRAITEQNRTQLDIADTQVTEISRTIAINLLYDRVTYTTSIPDNANPKNYNISTLNAADRIQLFYYPTEGMPPKVLQDLINRSTFGGTIIDGQNFYIFSTLVGVGYDNGNYDPNIPLVGYDFNSEKLTIALGTVRAPTFSIGNTIVFTYTTIDQSAPPAVTVNNRVITVTLTGTTLAQTVIDINNNAQLTADGISAVAVNIIPTFGAQLQISCSNGYTIGFTGSAVVKAGLPASATGSFINAQDLENYYDVVINGGDPLNTPATFGSVPQTASTINLDGNVFLQPYLDANHPEELTLVRAGDTLSIDVYTTVNQLNTLVGYDSDAYDSTSYDFSSSSDILVNTLRFPKSVISRYQGIVGGTTGPFTIGQQPQSKNGLFVSKNGVLLAASAYTVNWETLTVTLGSSISNTDYLSIISFGAGGGTTLKKRVFKNTSSATFDMKTPLTQNLTFVTVDGTLATFTVAGTVVTISSPLPSNSEVLIVLSGTTAFSTIETQNSTSTGGSWVVTLSSPPSPTLPPYIATHVFKNGLRLNPPPMKLYTVSLGTHYYNLPATASAPSKVLVWDNGIAQTAGVYFDRFFIDGFTISGGGTLYAVNDVVTVTGTGSGFTGHVATVDGGGAILTIAITAHGTDFTGTPSVSVTSVSGSGASIAAVINSTQVYVNSLVAGDLLLIQDNENGDYTITGGSYQTVTVASTSNTDVITCVTYTDDISYIMETETTLGSSTGLYALGGTPYDSNSILVYVDGDLKTYGEDYYLPVSNGVTSVEFLPNIHTSSDKLVFTYFMNFPEEPPIAFKIYKNIFGNFNGLRISDANSTVLTAALNPGDTTITVNDATVLGQPNITSQNPGVVFINGERITFWAVDTSTPGLNLLEQITRGSAGTGIQSAVLPIGTVLRDGSLNQNIPGGYNWEVNPNGLQYATSEQALFLLASPGSQDFGNP